MDAPTPSAPAPRDTLSWPRSVQSALVLILTAALFYLLGRTSLERTPLDIDHPVEPVRLDLNRATHAELRLLPGVGDSLAGRIVEHRLQHGPFPSVGGLREVAGVGAKTLERVRPLLFVTRHEAAFVEDAKEPIARKAEARSTKPRKVPPSSGVDVNLADLSELQKLPGIGPKTAQR